MIYGHLLYRLHVDILADLSDRIFNLMHEMPHSKYHTQYRLRSLHIIRHMDKLTMPFRLVSDLLMVCHKLPKVGDKICYRLRAMHFVVPRPHVHLQTRLRRLVQVKLGPAHVQCLTERFQPASYTLQTMLRVDEALDNDHRNAYTTSS